jgi:hypothetical protein
VYSHRHIPKQRIRRIERSTKAQNLQTNCDQKHNIVSNYTVARIRSTKNYRFHESNIQTTRQSGRDAREFCCAGANPTVFVRFKFLAMFVPAVVELRLGHRKYSSGNGLQRLSRHFCAGLSCDVDFAGVDVEEVGPL